MLDGTISFINRLDQSGEHRVYMPMESTAPASETGGEESKAPHPTPCPTMEDTQASNSPQTPDCGMEQASAESHATEKQAKPEAPNPAIDPDVTTGDNKACEEVLSGATLAGGESSGDSLEPDHGSDANPIFNPDLDCLESAIPQGFTILSEIHDTIEKHESMGAEPITKIILEQTTVYPDGTSVVRQVPVTRHITLMWVATVILANLLLTTHSVQGGVTEILRKLNIPATYYNCVDNMFRSDAIKLQALQDEWVRYVKENFTCYTVGGRILFTGDGVMNPKEGRHMPGVVRLHKESGTQSKPSCFHGIHVGALGIITLGENHGVYCTPVFMQIMQGLDPVANWEGSVYRNADKSLELQEIAQIVQVARVFGCSSYYLTDRASMNRNVFRAVQEANEAFAKEGLTMKMDVVVPTRKNVAMYKEPVRQPGPGRPPMKGDKLSREQFANDDSYAWRYGRVFMYGSKTKVRYKVANLLWQGSESGPPITLRFILIDCLNGGELFMLCTTDLQMSPLKAIQAYSLRFLCEEQFRVNKMTFHGFSMHFWSKHMPKNSFVRKGNRNILEDVTDPKDQEAILKTLKAMETHLTLAYVAQGLAQEIAMKQEYGGAIHTYKQVRSLKSVKCSEENVCHVITDFFDVILERYKDTDVVRFLKGKIDGNTEREAILKILAQY